jgi:two-component system LytT family response regulator
MLTAIAIDDESMALEVIKSHASKVPFLSLKAVFTHPIHGLEYLQQNPVDVLFLDIKMPDISGLEIAGLIPKDTMVIFTTAYSEYAVKSFELDALDYLLKPFSLSRFLKACQKAKDLKTLKNGNKESIFVKSGTEQIKINLEDLLYCEASGNYVSFHLSDEKFLSRMTFSELEQLLPSFFTKTHRSFIINTDLVTKVEKHQVELGHAKVPVSSTYYESLMDKLK